MRNLSRNGATKTFYAYRDSYNMLKLVHSEESAKKYARGGRYATVILPLVESFTEYEERKLVEAFEQLECLK